MRSTRLSLLFCLVGCALFVPAGAADEPFFPGAGNRGYDALDYDVDLVFEPKSGRIKARTLILARAEDDLQRLSLDFRGPRVRKVRVDSRAAEFRRRDGKLVLFPRQAIKAGSLFLVDVDYRGVPPKIVDPDGTPEGWFRTDDGVIAVGEPQGTAAWIPCNNVPSDKAFFSFDIRLPPGLKAVANGRRVAVARRGGHARFHWVEQGRYWAVIGLMATGSNRRR